MNQIIPLLNSLDVPVKQYIFFFKSSKKYILRKFSRFPPMKSKNLGLAISPQHRGSSSGKIPSKGSGLSRIPRNRQQRAINVPSVRGGRKAHPPKFRKGRKYNLKERNFFFFEFFLSLFEQKIFLYEEKIFDQFSKTKEYKNFFLKRKLLNFLEVKRKRKLKGKKSQKIGKKYRYTKKIFFYYLDLDSKIFRNLKGIEFFNCRNFNPRYYTFDEKLNPKIIITDKGLDFLLLKFRNEFNTL